MNDLMQILLVSAKKVLYEFVLRKYDVARAISFR
jgi:hypothetical protein